MKKIILFLVVSASLLLADFSRNDADEVVTDDITALMWQDNSMPLKMKWDDAKSYCDALELADHSDWHLPTKIELDSIIDKSVHDPSINTLFKNTISYRYWTSTPRESKNAAWYVNFSYGHKDGYYITDSNHVRCVRSSK